MQTLEELFNNGKDGSDFYAGILLIQIHLSDRFTHLRKQDDEIDAYYGIDLLTKMYQPNLSEPPHKMIQLMYGIALYHGIDIAPEKKQGEKLLLEAGIKENEIPNSRSLIDRDLLSTCLGRFGIHLCYTVPKYNYQMNYLDEVASMINNASAALQINFVKNTFLPSTFSKSAVDHICQIAQIVSEVPGVIKKLSKEVQQNITEAVVTIPGKIIQDPRAFAIFEEPTFKDTAWRLVTGRSATSGVSSSETRSGPLTSKR